jgi:hypothetical protein
MDNDQERLAALIDKERFDEALSLISVIESARSLTLPELLLKGRCIQLASGTGTPPLSEAERSFIQALEQDAEYVPALLELGWFYFLVEDDAKKAMPMFERVLALSLNQLREAIRGKRDCLEELQSGELAEKFLRGVISNILEEAIGEDDHDQG